MSEVTENQTENGENPTNDSDVKRGRPGSMSISFTRDAYGRLLLKVNTKPKKKGFAIVHNSEDGKYYIHDLASLKLASPSGADDEEDAVNAVQRSLGIYQYDSTPV